MFHQLQKLLPRKRVFTVNRTVERNRNLEHLSFNCCSSFHCTVKSLTREPRCILMAGPAFVALGPLIGNDIRAAVIHSRFRLPALFGRSHFTRVPSGLTPVSETVTPRFPLHNCIANFTRQIHGFVATYT